MPRWTNLSAAILASAAVLCAQYGRGRVWWDAGRGGILPWEDIYDNPDGQVTIVKRDGPVKAEGHPFFEPLGRNGRACVTCHQPANAMSISAAAMRERWQETAGKDPVFAAIDGSNCPDLPQEERKSHSLLLERGLFRIALPWPPPRVSPEFRIEVVRDPTGCNTGAVYGLRGANPAVSVYRRPRVAANLETVIAGPTSTTFMADGREPSLRSQAIAAILIHEQAEQHPTWEQLDRIVALETSLFAAQSADIRAGLLNEPGGPLILGPQNLAERKFRDLSSGSREGVRSSFESWRLPPGVKDAGLQLEFRASIARGSEVFFGREFSLSAGDSARTTCAACHASGTTRWMDIGTTDRSEDQALPDLPLFRVTCNDTVPPHPVLGRVIYTQDPGRALISGKCADVGSIALQQLRALAARSPYFSNGSARNLREVVEFYDRRFHIGYTTQEKQDLANFLGVL